jgi:hypothetical protein
MHNVAEVLLNDVVRSPLTVAASHGRLVYGDMQHVEQALDEILLNVFVSVVRKLRTLWTHTIQ